MLENGTTIEPEDVRLEREDGPAGVTIVAVVVERPKVSDLEFRGNKKLTTSQLKDKLKEGKAEVKVGGPISLRDVAKAKAALVEAYEAVKAMGEAADNVVFAEFLVGEDPMPYQIDFVGAFRKEYARLPKMFEAGGWDALNLAAKALREAGADASSAKLCESMRKPYQGALAPFDFSAADQTGLKLGSFVYSKVSAGNFSRLPFQAQP